MKLCFHNTTSHDMLRSACSVLHRFMNYLVRHYCQICTHSHNVDSPRRDFPVKTCFIAFLSLHTLEVLTLTSVVVVDHLAMNIALESFCGAIADILKSFRTGCASGALERDKVATEVILGIDCRRLILKNIWRMFGWDEHREILHSRASWTPFNNSSSR